jgi:2-oxoglutarate ferredoxin oxidoreductase subunit gamma
VAAQENSKAKEVYAVPITELAIKATGKELTANICALGIIAALGIVGEEPLKKAILKRIPKGTEELNMKAFEAGKTAIKK